MRRGIAAFLLVLFAVLLAPGADIHDHEDQRHTHRAPICSLFRMDDCTAATLPQVPAAPPPDGLPTP